ncbi:MAG TPA: methionine biosynthesis protein MetW [Casimicrobiaceae bacterium]|nr:methionine biosynthesis protein MetW [Casimicrobiaceae bacterium]
MRAWFERIATGSEESLARDASTSAATLPGSVPPPSPPLPAPDSAIATARTDSRGTRTDYATIAGWVSDGGRVLDLGCGDGSLLRFLASERRASGYGIEIDDAGVLASVRNGVDVIQSDLERGLAGFDDAAFDVVILSQTLQAMRRVEAIVAEMLRVGREAIVTFPNFGHWSHRLQIVRGRMPVSTSLPYQWYDTPNIHLCTVADFDAFLAERRYRVLDRVVLAKGQRVSFAPNLTGELAIYRFRKQ